MARSPDDPAWTSAGTLCDPFGRRYADSQRLMRAGYRGEDRPGPRQTRYLASHDQAHQAITFLGGCVHWKNRPFARPGDGLVPGEYIYIIDVNGGFFAIEPEPTLAGDTHHSTIPAGKGLICAGMLVVGAQHRLLGCSNRSGHYMPDLSCLLKAVYLFRKAGCSIDAFAVEYVPAAGFGHQGALQYATARDFLVNAPYP